MDAAARLVEPSPDEEIARARVEMASGRGAEAVTRMRALIERHDFEPMLHYWLAAAYGAAGDMAAHHETLKDAQTYHALQIIRDAGGDLDRFQSDPVYAAQIGLHFYEAKLMGAAAVAYGQAALTPGASVAVMLSWGLALQHQGRMDEALTAFTAANDQHPSARTHDFLLYACFFAEDGVTRHAEEVRRWAARYARPLDREGGRVKPLAGRKLRVGYVAPSFVGTQVRQFIIPVLENHDPETVDVYLYCKNADDEIGVPAKAIRSIGTANDADATALIRRDELDILVDLWGHTAGGRMGVFALKPAPIQAAWINYVQSTGLSAMDYVLHADCMDAPGTEELFVEKIWRMGPIIAPFRPDPRPDPVTTPALRNGFVTFASFNHPSRLNDQTVAAWARILNGRPGSRLILKYGYFVDPVLQNATCARFAAHDVDPSRIDFRGHSSRPDYLRELGDIDLALDPSPCPGGTTSSDAVANGVPVLTMMGPDFYSRVGVLRLAPLGLDELIAMDWDDYVRRALAVTEDPAALDALRRRVRERYDVSAIRDEAGFTRKLEAAFAAMVADREAATA